MNDDPFEILGVPARFDLAPGDLRAAYLAKSGIAHPDLAGLDDPEAAARSAALNRAKRVLDDPELRAEALLSRLGGPAKEQDRSLPPSFLQEMLQVREEIESETAGRDPAQVVKWEQWAQSRRRLHIDSVGKLFEGASDLAPGEKSARLGAIRMELNMWRYVQRLIEQLADADGASR